MAAWVGFCLPGSHKRCVDSGLCRRCIFGVCTNLLRDASCCFYTSLSDSRAAKTVRMWGSRKLCSAFFQFRSAWLAAICGRNEHVAEVVHVQHSVNLEEATRNRKLLAAKGIATNGARTLLGALLALLLGTLLAGGSELGFMINVTSLGPLFFRVDMAWLSLAASLALVFSILVLLNA